MKLILKIIFITFLTINVNGQIISSYGVKLGVGISNQSWDYNADVNLDFNNKVGITPRIFVDFLYLSFFNVEAEFGYIRKGFTDKVPITTITQPDGTGEFHTVNNSLDYLSFSVLAKLKYKSKIFSPYFLFGPQIDLLLNKDIDDGWKVIFDKFNKYNFGLSIGVGTEIKKVLPISFLIEYRYERDFKNNYDSLNLVIKNYSHLLLFGFKL